MQIFNLINCYFYGQKTKFSFNFFKDKISNNYAFMFILGALIAIQIMIIEFAGDFFKVSRHGLTMIFWITSLVLGFGSVLIEIAASFIPLKFI